MKGVKGFQKGREVSQSTRDKISRALSRKIRFNCDYCKKESQDTPSGYKKKKRHFCNTKCYSLYRKHVMKKHEQNSYGSGFPIEEREVRKKCRSILNHAVRDGLLTKKSCEECGREKVEAHHTDYSKPFDVEWLCFYHHRKRHGQNPELPEAK